MEKSQKNYKIVQLIISIFAIILMITPAILSKLFFSIILGVIIVIALLKSKCVSKYCNFKVRFIYMIIGFAFSVSLGMYFYDTWIPSSVVNKIANIVGLSSNELLVVISMLGILIATPTIASLFSYYVEIAINIIQEKEREQLEIENIKTFSVKKCFMILFGIYLFGLVPIIRANYNYIDDLGRVAEGYKGWEGFSRILSNILSTYIHMDNYLTDISPLTQIIAASIIAFSGILLLVIVYERIHFTLIEVLALIPLCLNPYFLQCISYKYDSPYMALSILGAILPLLYRNRSALVYICISVIGTIVMCTTYQASSGIYPILVILLMFLMWNRREQLKQIIIFCIRSVIGYAIGILFFRIFIMIPVDNYVSNALPKLKEFIPNYIGNLEQYYKLVLTDFKPWWILIVFLVIIGFVYTLIQKSEQRKWYSGIASCICIILMAILCFGMYPALESPLFNPRAMYGFSVFITLLGVCTVENSTKLAVKVPILLLGWTFLVFAFTYGNALSVQEEYTEFRISQVIEDLNDIDIFLSDKEIIVQVEGDIGQSPIIEAMPQNYQMLNRLIPRTFCGNGYSWGKYRFFNYYKLKNIVQDTDIDLTTYNLPVLEDHMYHTIYGNGSYILIELK